MVKIRKKESLYEYCKNNPDKGWILEQYDTERNYPLTPHDITKSSDKKVYFKFPCGHSRAQRVADKTGRNSRKCPECLNRGGIGRSLRAEYPEYADMFMEEKNGITADCVSAHNGKKYWWKCKRCGYEFEGKVSDVVSGHRVCDICSNQKRSFPEYCLRFYLSKFDPDCKVNHKIDNYKYDLYLPKYNFAIEYDGYPWHNSAAARKNDAKKDELCRVHNITLLRIRDSRLADNENLSAKIWEFTYDDKFDFLKSFPDVLAHYIGIQAKELDVDVKRDLKKIDAFRIAEEKKTSLLVHMPELKNFMDDEDDRNGNPEDVCSASHSIRFWLRDPKYPQLKWSMTAHRLFAKKDPYTQWIKMCIRMIERYPELEAQVCEVGNNIRETTVFRLQCKCGNKFEKSYEALIRKRKIEMCEDCLLKFRMHNLGKE